MELENISELLKACADFKHDYDNQQECLYWLNNYEGNGARTCLGKMINEYASYINKFGFFIDGMHTVANRIFSDDEIKIQLKYLYDHIPCYFLLKKGEEKLAKELFKKISG